MSLSYQFQFSAQALAELDRLDASVRKRIIKKIDFFQALANPLSHAKPLRGYENYVRFRVGDYRIIVKCRQDGTLAILLIVKIAHRREVY